MSNPSVTLDLSKVETVGASATVSQLECEKTQFGEGMRLRNIELKSAQTACFAKQHKIKQLYSERSRWTDFRAVFSLLLTVSLFSSPGVMAQTNDALGYQQVSIVLGRLTPNPIVLLQNGQFLDPVYDPNDDTANEALSLTLNHLLKPSLVYEPASLNFDQIYLDVLNNAEWATVPLLAGQRDDLSRQTQLLFMADGKTPSAGYKRYIDLRDKRDDLQRKYDDTPDDQRTPEMAAALQQANDDLRVRGRSDVYTAAEVRYFHLKDMASLAWRDNDLASANSSSKIGSNGKRYLPATISSALDNLDHVNWTLLMIDSGQLMHPPVTPIFGNTTAGINGWWSWGAIPSNTAIGCQNHLSTDDLAITLEVANIQIQRSWLDQQIFSSQAWQWTTNGPLLSDGKTEGNTGTAPLFADTVLIARSIILTGSYIANCIPYVREAIRRQETVSFGPFAIANTVTSYHSRFYLPAVVSTTSIRVVFPQILGFSVVILPKSPNPNSFFVWKSHS